MFRLFSCVMARDHIDVVFAQCACMSETLFKAAVCFIISVFLMAAGLSDLLP